MADSEYNTNLYDDTIDDEVGNKWRRYRSVAIGLATKLDRDYSDTEGRCKKCGAKMGSVVESVEHIEVCPEDAHQARARADYSPPVDPGIFSPGDKMYLHGIIPCVVLRFYPKGDVEAWEVAYITFEGVHTSTIAERCEIRAIDPMWTEGFRYVKSFPPHYEFGT